MRSTRKQLRQRGGIARSSQDMRRADSGALADDAKGQSGFGIIILPSHSLIAFPHDCPGRRSGRVHVQGPSTRSPVAASTTTGSISRSVRESTRIIDRSSGAHVTDDGHDYIGVANIRAWLGRDASQYAYTTTPMSATSDAVTGTTSIRCRLEGTFPGGLVDLDYTFQLDDSGRLANLTITPSDDQPAQAPGTVGREADIVHEDNYLAMTSRNDDVRNLRSAGMCEPCRISRYPFHPTIHGPTNDPHKRATTRLPPQASSQKLSRRSNAHVDACTTFTN